MWEGEQKRNREKMIKKEKRLMDLPRDGPLPETAWEQANRRGPSCMSHRKNRAH